MSSLHRSLAHPALLSFPTRRSSDLSLTHVNDCHRHLLAFAHKSFTYWPFSKSFLLLLFSYRSSLFKVPFFTYQVFMKVKKRSEEHTSELQSRFDLVCRLLLAKKKCT